MAEDVGYVTPEQLCVGLYIHLDMSWMAHPFMLNSFKISDQEQIDTLRGLGLERIRYEARRSDAEPTPLKPQAQAAPEPPHQLDPAQLAAIAAKKARLEHMAKHRQAITDCEKKLFSAGRAFKHISRNVFAKPLDSAADATKLSQLMVDSILTDKDIAIHLMSDKLGSEEVYFHGLNVAILALILGKELGLAREMLVHLGVGAMLHDIGKLEIPEKILYKTDPLTKPERDFLQQHVPYGLAIGKQCELPPEVMTILYQHHEYMDGSGYPRGLQGDAIAQISKIVSLVNDYDNLCNRINPNESYTPYEALALMFGKQRARYEPAALNVFIRCLGIYPPGTLVLLSNEVVGIVIAVNASKPLRPSVLIYDSAVPKGEAVILDLQDEPDCTIVKGLKPAQVPQALLDYLNVRKRMTYFADAIQS